MSEIYKFSYSTPQGQEHSFAELKDKVILVVNTATQCGLAPQFKELQALHEKYEDQGLVILGFPCNQFLGQEPLKDAEMEQSCEINFGVTFQLTQKVDVNGKNAHPVYVYLKKKLSGFLFSRIKWNFEKFLIDRNGIPIKRYAPTVKPKDMETEIVKLLKSTESDKNF